MNNVKFDIGRAVGPDFDQIVDLQNANSITVLSDEERADGFLSSAFSAAQFEEISTSVALVVARDNAQVIGFVCASTVASNRKLSLPAAMIARFPEIKIGSRCLEEMKSYIVGPVCIDKNYRGRGAFEGLYNRLFEETAKEFDVAIAFISTNNTRSVAAHKKVGMEEIDTFRWGDREFFIVGRSLDPIERPTSYAE